MIIDTIFEIVGQFIGLVMVVVAALGAALLYGALRLLVKRP